jgi:diguanylate cyclase (GGDEF)-like protein
MVLLPTLVTVALASSLAVSKWSERDDSVTTRSATLVLDALMHARAAVTDEYVPSAAIVYARSRGIGLAELDKLLNIPFGVDLTHARAEVGQSILSTDSQLSGDRAKLMALRREIDKGSVSFVHVQNVFNGITANIDTLWLTKFASLSRSIGRAGATTAGLQQDVNALQLSFAAFKAGLDQTTYAEEVLTAPYTTSVVANLVGTNALYASSTAGFPGNLGPQAREAWADIQGNSDISQFDKAVTLAISTGLRQAEPPYATNLKANARIFVGEIVKVNLLTELVLAASADLRNAASAQQSSVTSSFLQEFVLLIVLASLVVVAALWLARSVNRPLTKIAEAAGILRLGDFDVAPLEESGPRELASTAVAFNEMASTLRGVEAHAVALSARDLDDPALQTPLPGRTGLALQGALDRLQTSVRDAESRREELHKLATRDSLTGLMSRGAALDAIDRDLARASREGNVVALLFLDLDGLKAINDTFGHEGGDEALRTTADAIINCTRTTDIRARLGGDEFVVSQLRPGTPDEISALAERIRQQVADAEPESHGRRMRLGCSIGIAQSAAGDTADDLMRRADLALYEAKQAGRNRVAWFGPSANRIA